MPLSGHRQTAAKRLSWVESLGDELITRCAAAPVSDCARLAMHESPGAPVQTLRPRMPDGGRSFMQAETLYFRLPEGETSRKYRRCFLTVLVSIPEVKTAERHWFQLRGTAIWISCGRCFPKEPLLISRVSTPVSRAAAPR